MKPVFKMSKFPPLHFFIVWELALHCVPLLFSSTLTGGISKIKPRIVIRAICRRFCLLFVFISPYHNVQICIDKTLCQGRFYGIVHKGFFGLPACLSICLSISYIFFYPAFSPKSPKHHKWFPVASFYSHNNLVEVRLRGREQTLVTFRGSASYKS